MAALKAVHWEQKMAALKALMLADYSAGRKEHSKVVTLVDSKAALKAVQMASMMVGQKAGLKES